MSEDAGTPLSLAWNPRRSSRRQRDAQERVPPPRLWPPNCSALLPPRGNAATTAPPPRVTPPGRRWAGTDAGAGACSSHPVRRGLRGTRQRRTRGASLLRSEHGAGPPPEARRRHRHRHLRSAGREARRPGRAPAAPEASSAAPLPQRRTGSTTPSRPVRLTAALLRPIATSTACCRPMKSLAAA